MGPGGEGGGVHVALGFSPGSITQPWRGAGPPSQLPASGAPTSAPWVGADPAVSAGGSGPGFYPLGLHSHGDTGEKWIVWERGCRAPEWEVKVQGAGQVRAKVMLSSLRGAGDPPSSELGTRGRGL